MVDPIADFLTRMRNAQMVGHDSTTAGYSKMKENIAKVLTKSKFIAGFDVVGDGINKEIKVNFLPRKLELKRISKCGQRIYSSAQDLRKYKNGFGAYIVSTPKGVMTGYEARKKGIGGEVLCSVA
jgi:small subunit ribosomal protein S8